MVFLTLPMEALRVHDHGGFKGLRGLHGGLKRGSQERSNPTGSPPLTPPWNFHLPSLAHIGTSCAQGGSKRRSKGGVQGEVRGGRRAIGGPGCPWRVQKAPKGEVQVVVQGGGPKWGSKGGQKWGPRGVRDVEVRRVRFEEGLRNGVWWSRRRGDWGKEFKERVTYFRKTKPERSKFLPFCLRFRPLTVGYPVFLFPPECNIDYNLFI